MPRVSVIIPTHNRGEMLRRAIDSVLNQTYRDLELIVIADGCTDNTDEIVAAYNDSRMKFFVHEKSRGASAARNTGIRASTGQYIAFLDDDDEWLPDKLKAQVAAIEKSPPEVGLVYSWIEYIEDGTKKSIRAPELRGDIFVEMLDKQAITNSSALLIKREVLDAVPGFDEELPRGNDGDFIRRITQYYHVDYVPRVLARIHVEHGKERITRDDKSGLRNAIKAQSVKFLKFGKALSEHPEQAANIYSIIANCYFQLGETRKSLLFHKKAMLTNPWSARLYLRFIRVITEECFQIFRGFRER